MFVEIELDKAELTLLIGENGSGKSTFIEAITFALFNKPFRNVRKPQLLNTITKKDCVVEVEFSVGDSDYMVRRGIKPNVFEIYADGELLNQDSESRDYQELLEKSILKFNYKSFTQIVILGSTSYVPFMQLPTGTRREIVEDLLDLQIFGKMNEILKKKVDDLKKLITTTTSSRNMIDEKIKMVKKHEKELKIDRKNLIAERVEKIRKIDDEMMSFQSEVSNFISLLEETKTSTKQFDSCRSKSSELEKLHHRLTLKIESLEKDKKSIEKMEVCPTCEREVDTNTLQRLITSKTLKIDEAVDGKIKMETKLSELYRDVAELQSLEKQISKITNSITLLKSKMTSLKSRREDFNEEIEKLERAVDEIENSGELEKLELEKESLNQSLSEARLKEETYSVTSLLLKDSGIKSTIVKQYVPIINKLINKYLASLDFFVDFNIDENFNETIKSAYRSEFSYSSFSEGEKFRINLAILFTWREIAKLRNSMNTNLLIMDEVFDSSLDDAGIDEFIKLLKLVTQNDNVFVISHKGDTLYDKFDRVLTFKKVKNFSQMEVA